ncbi:hypothetical protein [Paenibacillus puerhi]|uniref:hypothetical protein n=1 Tax=Paenibacillus puerhi TaxID=2692622 RepID=UPI001F346137|nr:hypothetical protein [Paenibacillus puerhi]
MGSFSCLGTPVRADESRSAAVCHSPEGEERVVIAAKGYVLIVDPGSGRCVQVAFPEGLREYPFASMSSRAGLFYTGAGRMLMALDPFAERFVAWLSPSPEEEIVGMALAEDEEGHIWATTYPGCQLLRWDVRTGECGAVARLDTEQKYAMSLAAGPDGWIYAGLGTTGASIAAYRSADATLLALRAEGQAVRGSGQVHLGMDGYVYAGLPAQAGAAAGGSLLRFRLEAGRMYEVEGAQTAAGAYRGQGYNKLHRDLGLGRKLIRYELAEGELAIEEADGRQTIVSLTYEGNGTELSPMTGGPDGRLYGTSNHPLHLYRYDPGSGELMNAGGKAVERGGGGNICAYAAQGPYLVGAAYAAGRIHLLDTRRPLSAEGGRNRNPRLLHEDERIHRPRSALAHPDGAHVLIGGFPGYGAVGGGLAVVHVGHAAEAVDGAGSAASGAAVDEWFEVYDHDQVVQHQSTVSLAAMSGGDVMGGTSIETPGGAAPLAKEAVLYRFDWRERRVVQRWVPIPEAREISLLVTDRNDLVHGVTSSSEYFLFDPSRGKVLYREDLSKWGSIVRQGLLIADPIDEAGLNPLIGSGAEPGFQRGTDAADGGQVVAGLLSRALFRIRTDGGRPELAAWLPKEATSGIAMLKGKLYYGCGSELWSYAWAEGEVKRAYEL